MMSSPLLTVGIPFYNSQDTLLDSIKSIFAQSFTDWELILLDDGSTGKSLQIAKSIDDPRVRVISDGCNKKLPARLNQIIEIAQGQYIARMDADDLSHPERFARQLEFLDGHKDVDVVGTSACILDKQGHPTSKIVVAEAHEDICRDKYEGFSMAHATVMAKRTWWHRHRYNEKASRSQDYELWLTNCTDSLYSNVPDLLYFCNEFVSHKFSKYAESKITVAKAIWKYAPVEIGRFRAAYYAGRRYIQIAVYAAFGVLGLRHLLVQHRYSQLTPEERQKANAIIDIIRKTEVPLKKILLKQK